MRETKQNSEWDVEDECDIEENDYKDSKRAVEKENLKQLEVWGPARKPALLGINLNSDDF